MPSAPYFFFQIPFSIQEFSLEKWLILGAGKQSMNLGYLAPKSLKRKKEIKKKDTGASLKELLLSKSSIEITMVMD
jgi:hypothetical protein